MKIEDYHKIDKIINDYEIKYDEIDVSYMARLYYVALLRNKQGVGNKHVQISKDVIIRLLIGLFTTCFFLFRKKKYIVFSNSERRKKLDSYYYDRVASIVSEVTDDVLFVENPVLVSHKKPVKEIILSDAVFYFLSWIFSMIYFKKEKLKIDKRFYELGDVNGIKINFVPIVRRFVGQYMAMSFYIKYVNKPKLIFSVYPSGYMGYNFAFKENNIPIIELQHGVIYSTHFSYNTVMYEKSKQFKPDYVFTYGKKDKECLETLRYIPSQNIYVVGSYGLQKSKEVSIGQMGEYLKAIVRPNVKKIMVVATTNDFAELYKFSENLSEHIGDSFQILLLPRHKEEIKSERENFIVLDVDKTNVFELYNVCDYLLTMVSTAALEAMYMDIPVFIYETENCLFSKNYPYLKSLNYIQNSEEFVLKLISGEYNRPKISEIEEVYATNIYENFETALSGVEL